MKQQKGISTTLSVLLITFLVILGGVIVYKYYLTPDETTNWEIYKSTYLGFEIKYPLEWFLYENEQNVSTVKSGEWLPVGTLPKGNAKILFERTGVQSINDLITERFDITTNKVIVSDSIMDLDSLSGREIVYTCKTCGEKYISEIDEYLPGEEGRVVFFTEDNDVFYIWLYYYKNDPKVDYYINIFNQMLPTFKFAEKPQDKTTNSEMDKYVTSNNYKKYNSEEFKFGVNYPEDWTIEEGPISSKRQFDEKYGIWFTSQKIERAYINIIIDIYDNSNNLSIDGWTKEYFEGPNTFYQPISKEEIEVSTINGLEIIVELYAKQRWIFLLHNGLVYEIKLAYPMEKQPHSKLANEIFDQFLSSFKFLR